MKILFDIDKAIDWQRSNASKFISLIQQKADWYDSTFNTFVEDWFRDVFDLNTANDFGLAVWSLILDVPLYGVTKKSPHGFDSFGFNGDKVKNFDKGGFNLHTDSAYKLTTEQKRIALKLKAYSISMSGSSVEINERLTNIFGGVKLWCIDNLDMTLTYKTADKQIYIFSKTLLANYLLPRPAGVEIRKVEYVDPERFGFKYESKLNGQNNFDRGNFLNE